MLQWITQIFKYLMETHEHFNVKIQERYEFIGKEDLALRERVRFCVLILFILGDQNTNQVWNSFMHEPFYIKNSGISRQRTNSSSRSDDENETSFSDDLNTSWPVMTNKKVKNRKARPSTVIRRTRTVEVPTEKAKNTAPVRFDVAITNSDTTRKNRRKRERERFHAAKKVSGIGTAELVRSAINGTILDLDERPKTATLKRPSILDESLKDKVSQMYLSCI